MQFTLAHTDMGASGHCCMWIAAEGEITMQTPDDFKAFLKTNSGYWGPTVRLNSPGGSLLAGIKLGEMFREGGFSTEVGATHTTPGAEWDNRKRRYVAPPGVDVNGVAVSGVLMSSEAVREARDTDHAPNRLTREVEDIQHGYASHLLRRASHPLEPDRGDPVAAPV
jgi:hypothetical protein